MATPKILSKTPDLCVVGLPVSFQKRLPSTVEKMLSAREKIAKSSQEDLKPLTVREIKQIFGYESPVKSSITNIEESPSKATRIGELNLSRPNTTAKRNLALEFLKEEVEEENAELSGIFSGEVKSSLASDFSDLLDAKKEQMFLLAKEHSTRAEITPEKFDHAFKLLKEVFLKAEDQEFLEKFMIKETKLGGYHEFEETLKSLELALKDIGIKSVPDFTSINFWSGKEGALRAKDEMHGLSDSQIPLFQFLFACSEIFFVDEDFNKKRPRTVLALSVLFSNFLASYATGPVNVYLSHQKEGKPCMYVDSAWWEGEFSRLSSKSEVTSLNIHFYLGKDEKGEDIWSKPIDAKNDNSWKEKIVFSSKKSPGSGISGSRLSALSHRWSSRAESARLLPVIKEDT